MPCLPLIQVGHPPLFREARPLSEGPVLKGGTIGHFLSLSAQSQLCKHFVMGLTQCEPARVGGTIHVRGISQRQARLVTSHQMTQSLVWPSPLLSLPSLSQIPPKPFPCLRINGIHKRAPGESKNPKTVFPHRSAALMSSLTCFLKSADDTANGLRLRDTSTV